MKFDREHQHCRVGQNVEIHMMGGNMAVRCTKPMFTVPLLDDLWYLFTQVPQFQTSSFIWLGYARKGIFQTGGHLMHMVQHRKERQVAQYGEKCIRLIKHLINHPMPTTAIVDGICVGGGLESALACRAVNVLPNSVLQFPEYNFDAFPGMGGRLFSRELTINCLDTLNEGGRVQGPVYLHRPLPLGLVGGILRPEDAPVKGDKAVKLLVNAALDKEVAAWTERMCRLLADPTQRRQIEARARLQEQAGR